MSRILHPLRGLGLAVAVAAVMQAQSDTIEVGKEAQRPTPNPNDPPKVSSTRAERRRAQKLARKTMRKANP